MPLNGSGSYTAPASSWNPAVTTTTVNSTDWNALLADLTTALSTALYKDGQQTPTANLPMGGFKFTGLAAGTTAGDSVRYQQVMLLAGGTMAGDMLVPDSNLQIVGSVDATKKARFEVDGLTTATTRVYTLQNSDDTLVGRATTDTLTNKTLTSPVIDTAVTGTAVATQAQQETGTATDVLVTPGRQKFHPSAAKVWANFNAAGTVAQSFNVSSVTSNGTGDWTVNFSTAFSAATYAAVFTCGVAQTTGGGQSLLGSTSLTTLATGSLRVLNVSYTGSTNTVAVSDGAPMCVACFGDQ